MEIGSIFSETLVCYIADFISEVLIPKIRTTIRKGRYRTTIQGHTSNSGAWLLAAKYWCAGWMTNAADIKIKWYGWFLETDMISLSHWSFLLGAIIVFERLPLLIHDPIHQKRLSSGIAIENPMTVGSTCFNPTHEVIPSRDCQLTTTELRRIMNLLEGNRHTSITASAQTYWPTHCRNPRGYCEQLKYL